MNGPYLFRLFGQLSDGLGYTLIIFSVTLILSIPLGLCLTLLKRAKIPVLGGILNGYIGLMRGTPLMLQLFFFYFGVIYIPFVGPYLTFDRLTASLIAFVLNYAAYFCEIFRGGLISVDRGQYEAGMALGLKKRQVMARIVLPQMIRVTLPPLCNECMTLVKDTALVTAIGVTEILYYAKASVNRDVNPLGYVAAALFYLVMNWGVERLFNQAEKRLQY